MRHLIQPRVFGLSCVAALVSALACYPRLSIWQTRSAPIWYLEAVIFTCGIILWSFVFAWHARYAGRPVFIFKLEPKPVIVATLSAIIMGTIYHLWLDPELRSKWPQEFPTSPPHWLAFVLFSLSFNQLCLTFAPYAWLMRLFKNPRIALGLTVLFGCVVLGMKINSLTTTIPVLLIMTLLIARMLTGFLVVSFFLRGGVMLAWWWTLVFEGRLLLDLIGQP